MISLGLKLNLFSTVTGRVLNGNKPVVNAVVKRTYKWRGESVSDEQVTDRKGDFYSPKCINTQCGGFFPIIHP